MADTDPSRKAPESTQSAEALERRYDPELNFRPMGRRVGWFVAAVLVAMSLYHLQAAGFGPPRELIHKGIHLAFVLGLVFLVFGATRGAYARSPISTLLFPGGLPLWDWALAAAAVVVTLYLPLLPTEQVAMRVGNPATSDIVAGTLLLILVLEAARRSMGWTLPLIVLGVLLPLGALWLHARRRVNVG